MLFSVAGLTAPTVTYIGVGGLALRALMLTLAGTANAFFRTYWTLACWCPSGRCGEEPARAGL